MGRAEDLLERIQQEGITAIEALIADRASEELFLEFKQSASNGSGSHLHDRDRTNLRKAISGFANAEGGVIVWGIECSRQVANGDVAATKVPIENPRRFVSWLEGAVSGCTVPPVTGVKSIAVLNSDDCGFVATYIPQSSHAPHQVAGEGKYMIRAGSDFVVAPHGVVAGLFGKPPHPDVFPNFILSPAEFSDSYAKANFTIALINNGQVVAEDLFLTLMFPERPLKGQGVRIDPVCSWPVTTGLGNFVYSWVCPREFRLAPRGAIEVAKVWLIVGQPAVADFRCVITAGCRNAIPYSQELLVRRDELDTEINRLIAANLNPAIDYDRHKAAQMLLGIPDPA